jgi:hypothetical protein
MILKWRGRILQAVRNTFFGYGQRVQWAAFLCHTLVRSVCYGGGGLRGES